MVAGGPKCKCADIPFNGQKWGDKHTVSHFFGVPIGTVEHWIQIKPPWLQPYMASFPRANKNKGKRVNRWLFDLHGLDELLRSKKSKQ